MPKKLQFFLFHFTTALKKNWACNILLQRYFQDLKISIDKTKKQKWFLEIFLAISSASWNIHGIFHSYSSWILNHLHIAALKSLLGINTRNTYTTISSKLGWRVSHHISLTILYPQHAMWPQTLGSPLSTPKLKLQFSRTSILGIHKFSY